MKKGRVINVTSTLEAADFHLLSDDFQQEPNQSHFCKKGIHKNLHVVGLGGGGSLTLEHYYNQGLQAKLTCIASKEFPKLPSKIKSIHCNVPKKYDSIDD
ncbi:MAG: hypothetical protein WHS63_08520 [Tenuifilum sp.]|uniref:hypothetical protein n=1 Tax=Tenuifilum sp. TaxID=2760880 RepID=UPI0030A271E0